MANVMECLVCHKAMATAEGFPCKQEDLSRCIAVDGGGTVEVSFGWGSRYDCCTALGFLCDDCFKANLDRLVNHENGFGGKGPPKG